MGWAASGEREKADGGSSVSGDIAGAPGTETFGKFLKLKDNCIKAETEEAPREPRRRNRGALFSARENKSSPEAPAPKKAEMGHQERKSGSHSGQGLWDFGCRSAPEETLSLPMPVAPVLELRDPQLHFGAGASPVTSSAPGEGLVDRRDMAGSHLPPSALTSGMRAGLCGAGFT